MNAGNGKSMSKTSKFIAIIEAPGVKGWHFMPVWIFKKAKMICMEKDHFP